MPGHIHVKDEGVSCLFAHMPQYNAGAGGEQWLMCYLTLI